jgi:pyruvate formate lyase activating enzyme
LQGLIFDIQRFSIHDGPGLRTTVFLKGCPLRCRWCHNIESQAPEPLLSFTPSRCIGCGACVEACPRRAHALADGGHTLDRAVCTVCGKCADVCVTQALEMVGRLATVSEVLEIVLRDRPFYAASGGGMTLSGGEPLSQIDFSEALLSAAKDAGLHSAVETTGFAKWADVERIVPLVDLFLCDLKETDDARHREWTGVGNALIIENLRRLSRAGARVRIRLPLVPGVNDRGDHFDAIARLARDLKSLEGVEVIAYHRLGEGKAARFGVTSSFSAETPDAETRRSWAAALAKRGVRVLQP